MILIVLLEWSLALLFLLFIVTQIVIPMWQNKPYFPIFHRKALNLESQLSAIRGEVDEVKLEEEIRRERDRAERLRGSQNVGGGSQKQ